MARRPFVILAIVLVGLLVISAVVFRRYAPYRLPADIQQPPKALMVMNGVHVTGMTNRSKAWSLDAQLVELSQNRSTTTVSRIRNGKIFVNKDVVLQVSAAKAIYDIYAKNLQLSGGVSIRGKNKQSITGSGAYYIASSGVLSNIGPVTFQNAWGSVSTNRLVVDLNKNEMAMWNIEMKFDPNEVSNAQ